MTEVNEVNFSKGGKMAEGEGGRGLGRLIRIIVIAVIALVVLGGAGFGAWWFLSHRSADEGARPMAGGKEGPRGASSAELKENPQYVDLGSFTVNLAEGRRFVKASMQVMTADLKGQKKASDKAAEYLKPRIAELKDIAVTVLQQQTSDTLKSAEGREQLKADIEKRILVLLPDEDRPAVLKVLVTEFIIQ